VCLRDSAAMLGKTAYRVSHPELLFAATSASLKSQVPAYKTALHLANDVRSVDNRLLVLHHNISLWIQASQPLFFEVLFEARNRAGAERERMTSPRRTTGRSPVMGRVVSDQDFEQQAGSKGPINRRIRRAFANRDLFAIKVLVQNVQQLLGADGLPDRNGNSTLSRARVANADVA